METNDEQRLTLFTHYRVSSADTDMEARLRPGSLVNMLIQSAIQSADKLGLGFGGLRKEKLFWVLSRMTLEIIRPLKWYENVVVETWPKDVEGILYLRDYKVTDESGELVARATSGWLAVDIESKRPRKIEGTDIESLVKLRNKHAIQQVPEKLANFNADHETKVATTYFDLDLNKHVTSTRYIDWMMDSIAVDYLVTHYPKTLSINYMKETRLGEIIQIKSLHDPDEVFQFEGFHQSTQQASFRGKIIFS
jgi:medium-chain acyl-[acyl-carrier-protein] hydrolase